MCFSSLELPQDQGGYVGSRQLIWYQKGHLRAGHYTENAHTDHQEEECGDHSFSSV